MSVPDDLAPWDMQPHEGSRPFHAFAHYRDLPAFGRSLDKAWREHRLRCEQKVERRVRRADAQWEDWSSRWGWVERSQAWDREQDRVAREKILKDQSDARARHARMAQATLAALSIPSRAILDALQDPLVMQKLTLQARTSTKSFIKLIDLVSWAAKSIPGLVDVERLALGLTTDAVSLEVHHVEDPAFQIPGDPEAADLALALLDRFARLAEHAPATATPQLPALVIDIPPDE